MPARFDQQITRDSDAEVVVTVTKVADDTPKDLTAVGVSLAADVLDGAGVVQESYAVAISGAGNNVATLTLTDTQTGAGQLPDSTYRFAFDITEADNTTGLLAGGITMNPRGVPGTADRDQVLIADYPGGDLKLVVAAS